MTYPELLKKVVLSCIVFSCVPALLPAAGTEPPFEIFISADIPFLDETKKEALFNARSDYKQMCLLDVQFKKKPKLRKEFVLIKPPIVKWSSNGVWREADVLDENGNVDPCKRRISLKQKSDWGKEDRFSATVHYYEVREHPLPTNPDGSPADNGPYWLASDTDSLIAVAPEVEIESITFNHIPGNSDSDGIDLRTNYKENDIVGPEWTPAGTQAVAYRAGVRPTVKVNFKLLPERLTRVKATATETGLGLTWGIAEAWTDRDNGQFSGVTSVSSEVNKGNVTWSWSATGFNGVPVSGWNNFRETEFPVYKILDKPQYPWREGAGTQKPWVTALDFVIGKCDLKGGESAANILRNLTQALHKKPYQSKSMCVGTYYFNYTNFMSDNSVNCYDSAGGLALSSRILGIPLAAKKHEWIFGYNFHCYDLYQDRIVYDSCSAMPTYLCFGVLKDFYLYKAQSGEGSISSDIPLFDIQ